MGTDMLVMPSLCAAGGLTPMLALHYRTAPIVPAIGGMLDAVVES